MKTRQTCKLCISQEYHYQVHIFLKLHGRELKLLQIFALLIFQPLTRKKLRSLKSIFLLKGLNKHRDQKRKDLKHVCQLEKKE